MSVRRVITIGVLSLMLLGLAACAHKDLTAPCNRDNISWSSDCGPLRPINS